MTARTFRTQVPLLLLLITAPSAGWLCSVRGGAPEPRAGPGHAAAPLLGVAGGGEPAAVLLVPGGQPPHPALPGLLRPRAEGGHPAGQPQPSRHLSPRNLADTFIDSVDPQDGCFADYHCNDLPNTECAADQSMPRYNMSCQCLPGNKPFLPDPRTGLVEGCAPLTDQVQSLASSRPASRAMILTSTQDKATVEGCSRKFTIKNKDEWVPETYFPVNQEVSSFFVKFAPEGDIESTAEDTAVVRLLDAARGKEKMYSVKISKKGGKLALLDSRITRPFFFTDSRTEREVDSATDTRTTRLMQEDYVGFWLTHRYEPGYGAQIR